MIDEVFHGQNAKRLFTFYFCFFNLFLNSPTITGFHEKVFFSVSKRSKMSHTVKCYVSTSHS